VHSIFSKIQLDYKAFKTLKYAHIGMYVLWYVNVFLSVDHTNKKIFSIMHIVLFKALQSTKTSHLEGFEPTPSVLEADVMATEHATITSQIMHTYYIVVV
jgi:hypothetical protein